MTAPRCRASLTRLRDGEDDLRALSGPASWPAEQDHTGLGGSAESEQCAEVSVCSDQDAAVLIGRGEDLLVGCAA